MKYLGKTFDDPYGRHALVYVDSGDVAEGVVDVCNLLPTLVAPYQQQTDYQPRHAAEGIIRS